MSYYTKYILNQESNDLDIDHSPKVCPGCHLEYAHRSLSFYKHLYECPYNETRSEKKVGKLRRAISRLKTRNDDLKTDKLTLQHQLSEAKTKIEELNTHLETERDKPKVVNNYNTVVVDLNCALEDCFKYFRIVGLNQQLIELNRIASEQSNRYSSAKIVNEILTKIQQNK